MAAICTCLDDCDCKAALIAKEPYINVDDEMEVCCCSKKRIGEEDFDCNAGDPHLQPTVAAFKHGFEYFRRKRQYIVKRKEIYDEIVQHGTKEEIKEARVSLLKQLLEDGTKEEQEEARVSLEIEETEVIVETEIEGECNCPEIQEIVVMIEDSDCDEPMCAPYASEYEICEYDPMPDREGEYMMPYIPEYQNEMNVWETDPYVELPEEIQENEGMGTQTEPGAKTLQTQTPSGEHLLTQDPRKTTQTQTPRTSHTQTENTLETQTPLATKSSGNVDKDRVSKTKQNKAGSETSFKSTVLDTKKSKTDLVSLKSTEHIKTKDDATSVKSEDSTSKKNKLKLKKDRETQEDGTSVKSEDSTSKKNKLKLKKDRETKEDAKSVKSENSTSKKNKMTLKDKIFKGLKDVRTKKSTEAQSTHSDEEKTKTATDKGSDVEQSSEKQETSTHAECKKRKKKSSSKCTEKSRKLSKAEKFMYKSFQPPKCLIKPRCVCFADQKAKLQKETDCAKRIDRPDKSTQRKCECCCNCEKTKKPICNKKTQKEKRTSDRTSEVSENKSHTSETADEPQECSCCCNCKQIQKSTPEKPKPKSKCRDNQTRCDCVIKCKRKSKCSSANKDDENTTVDTWVPEEEIYYPPPEPEPQYPNFCQPANCLYYNNSAGLPDKQIFNFPPPNFSSIYQEYPQNEVCPETGMVFSVQFEQDRSSSEYARFQNFQPQPAQESETSFRLVFADEDQDEYLTCSSANQSESSSSLSSDDEKDLKIPCRCKKPEKKVPCRCNNRPEKIPCRC